MRINIKGIPCINGFGAPGCTPFFEIYQVHGLINELVYDNKDDKNQVKFYYKTDEVIDLVLNAKIHLYGNIMIQFKNKGRTSNSDLFRITFNTAFIDYTNCMICSRWQLSPENLHKDFSKIGDDF